MMAHLIDENSESLPAGRQAAQGTTPSMIHGDVESGGRMDSRAPSPFSHADGAWRSEKWEPSGGTIWGAEKILQESNRVSFSVMRAVKRGAPIDTGIVKSTIRRMVINALSSDRQIIVLNKIERGDECSFLHVVNVAFLSISFLHYLHYDSSLVEEVGVGAFLHDIGKARVPDTLLCKRAVLTKKEAGIIKDHVRYTHALLSSTEGIAPLSLLVASQHHERYGGTGYPLGLKGDEISIYSQALSIVDMYDAITSCRCYSKSENSQEALKQIERLTGVNFNGALVEHFAGWIGAYLTASVKAPMGRAVTVMLGPDYAAQGGMMASNGY